MPTVAVLGCSGFVGSHVTSALLARGYTVRGTLREADGPKATWLRGRLEGPLTLHSAHLRDEAALERAMTGCEGVFVCAGTERQEPATIEVMFGGARAVLDVAQRLGIEAVMIQSSTGSMNPVGPEPDPKSEAHWSDPLQQIGVGKYSPAAKTLMEALALRRMEESDGSLRVCVFNSSLILGPEFSPEAGPSARFLASILKGDRMTTVPDGSMSMIDVRDLAQLHVAAFEDPDARGRYVSLVQSWHWKDILAALGRIHAPYTPPRWPDGKTPSKPTRYDPTRRDGLGVELRGLDAMLTGAVDDLVAKGELASS